jgi:membrane protein
LAQRLRVDALQLEPVLEILCTLDWIGLLNEELPDEAARYVLLANPDTTPLAPLLNELLLRQVETTENLWKTSLWPSITLRQAL